MCDKFYVYPILKVYTYKLIEKEKMSSFGSSGVLDFHTSVQL